ncbi:protoporphyrinogen oxidase [Alkalibacillus almallahensis]|uniref:protoporphyrinogen oxidase n=1 Tax=Alkalibacillus almallahensis TaxID=1379154 RepID=UPI00141E88B5|nr:protoporphyrinogen oxidase [Alkalibacillus almallahensis]NIK12640.1 oxygen-dependent protoporphyrinogen oxidase [Alkalibacillus almallahensis]
MAERKQIAIIGGGITGLTAAYYLQKNNVEADITLFEASDQLGGKISTIERDGFTIERGPDSFLERKKTAKTLAQDLGLGDRLIRSATGKAFILSQDELHPMPAGAVMGVPTDMKTFMQSTLFSASGKLNALKDFVTSRTEVDGDISVGHFFRRRLGDQVVDRLIHPLISGIYAGNIDNLSLQATFPHFLQTEQKYGSLIRGLQKTTPSQQTSGKKQGMFLTLDGGLQTLVNGLADALECDVRTSSPIERVSRQDGRYMIDIEGEEDSFEADYVIATTPHEVTAQMFSDVSFMDDFQQTKNTSVANVAIAFDEESVKNLPDGTGFVVSRKEGYRITACTWTHKKWPHTTPEGSVLLRAYVGKPGDEEVLELSDDEIADLVIEDLKKIMTIEGEPRFHIVTRWYNAMPQYTVGHLDRVKKLETHLENELPGVFVIGNTYRGVGLPDCMDQAIRTVKTIETLES